MPRALTFFICALALSAATVSGIAPVSAQDGSATDAQRTTVAPTPRPAAEPTPRPAPERKTTPPGDASSDTPTDKAADTRAADTAGDTPDGRAAAMSVADFRRWVAGFVERAKAAGIGAETVAAAFRGVGLNRRVVELDSYQPEFVTPVGDYVVARTKPRTVARARALSRKHGALFDRIEKAYGVPREYIIAIWRLETGFGANFGSFDIFEALATLAYIGRRDGFWEAELLAALRIVDRGFVPAERMKGSWAGAMGHTQFIPTTYLKRAVDFDRDGRRDLWNSLPDAFGSTANFLAKAGWQPGAPFGVEVTLPDGFDYTQAHAGVKKPVAAWREAGVTRADGSPLPDFTGETSIIVPSGHKGPIFLVTHNYRALLEYNNAAAYAITVGVLAECIAGRCGLKADWPVDDRMLKRKQKEELQERLAALGFDPGPIDGKVGPSTKAAVRAFQKSVGRPADGYANHALLELVRNRSSKFSPEGVE